MSDLKKNGLAAIKALDDLGGVSMRALDDVELRHLNNMLHHWEQMTLDELKKRNAERIAKRQLD